MNILKLSILAISMLFSSTTYSQSPQKKKGSFKVLCVNKIDTREIFYNKDKNAWCDGKITNVCSLNRKNVVKKVCNKVYKTKLARLEKSDANAKLKKDVVAQKKSDQILDLEQEQIDIELKQIEIEQRKLDLRKRELKLSTQVN